MSSSISSSSSSSSCLDHLMNISPSPSDQLCYVQCNFCDTVLAVSVPCTSLFKTVTVRCGHCTNLLSVNMRGLHLPTPTPNTNSNSNTNANNNNSHLQLGHDFFSPSFNILEEMQHQSAQTPNLSLMNQRNENASIVSSVRGGYDQLPKAPPVNKPPEKRQRVPSAYNRFIKDEIQRIKAGNPDITHREAFSAAAKNWAHFPHIHFGLMPDQSTKKTNVRQQERDDLLLKDGFFSATTNIGVSPY
ncbi:hypothetical protein MKW98_030994 [Papaver atlanticum]|uniref:Uncharacterized protein n=1 Tax=Papaver atlanticum TaxID=357466 RepID=A0AAD4S6R5_9MAGN|nr:hypothetical protein MKW98_030994 [Papaver atlanticum]